AFHERCPGSLLAGRIAGEEHPQVLDARTRHAVVEIHEQRSLFAPQDVAGVAIAMDPQPRQPAKGFETLSDSSDHLCADERILFGQRLGYKTAVYHPLAGLVAEAFERQRLA